MCVCVHVRVCVFVCVFMWVGGWVWGVCVCGGGGGVCVCMCMSVSVSVCAHVHMQACGCVGQFVQTGSLPPHRFEALYKRSVGKELHQLLKKIKVFNSVVFFFQKITLLCSRIWYVLSMV